MRIFISGGCKNGKSGHAQRIARDICPVGAPLYYVATMRPVDSEDDARIARHRQERAGWGFITAERDRDIHRLIDTCDPGGCFLIDSATALLANAMFGPDGSVNTDASDRLCRDFETLLAEVRHVVVVSDAIYSDAALYDDLTEGYRKGLAQVDRRLAALCDVVAEAAFGSLLFHKGETLYKQAMEGMRS